MASLVETRREQMLPKLDVAEIDRLRRFGETRAYRAGERLMTAGDVSLGIFVILDGEVTITQRSPLGHDEAIVTHGPGSVMARSPGFGSPRARRRARDEAGPGRTQLNELSRLIDAGMIRPIVEAVLPLHQARDAYERGIRDHPRGKLVLAVVDDDGGMSGAHHA